MRTTVRPVIKLRYGKFRCLLCVIEGSRRSWKLYKSLNAMARHLREHSFGGMYSYKIDQTPTRNGNHHFTITGTCACGCEEPIEYSIPYMPDHGPPYFRSGHLSRKVRNKGMFKKGDIPANKGTKGSMKPNRTSFKKGNEPVNDKGGVYISPDGYVMEWNGEYQPSGPRKYVSRARMVMEEVLDRPLGNNEVVIHLDNDRLNDDPANLKVITKRENAERNGYIFRGDPDGKEKWAIKKAKRPKKIMSSVFCPTHKMLILPGKSCIMCSRKGELNVKG